MLKKINQVEPNILDDDISSVTQYISSGSWITEHNTTREFENKISKFVGRQHAVAVPNGTIALYLSLLASGMSKGKRIAVPNMTMVATINAILWADCEPVLIDVNDRLCMSIDSLKSVKNLDGVIYVPLNGRTEEGLEIQEYCEDNEIVLIEDSAHALGSTYKSQNCGHLGNASVFSFTPHKIITMGQGGMVLIDDKELFEYLENIKTFNRSKDKSDWHEGFGLNFKITDLQASLGISQFNKLEGFIRQKKEILKLYKHYLNENLFINFYDFETPWFFDIVCESINIKNDLSNYLRQHDIETRDSYPPLSKQKFLKLVEKADLTFSESIAERILWLPSSTNLTQSDVKRISEKINIFFNEN